MDELFRHPIHAVTLDDQDECAGESLARKQIKAVPAFDINLNPVSDPQELEFLAGLVLFHHISNKLLFKLVLVATGFEVRDRWVAIRAIVAKRIPIPVAKPLPEVRHG